MSKQDIPEKLLRQMQEAKKGYFEFDTAAPGPFQLPLMDEFEEAMVEPDLGQILLQFRDYQEKKTYRIPLRGRTLKRLVDFLATIQNQYGEKLKTQDEKLFSGTSETH